MPVTAELTPHLTPELTVADRRQKREIRQLEQELHKWQVLVDSITGEEAGASKLMLPLPLPHLEHPGCWAGLTLLSQTCSSFPSVDPGLVACLPHWGSSLTRAALPQA